MKGSMDGFVCSISMIAVEAIKCFHKVSNVFRQHIIAAGDIKCVPPA